jgi:hypothetical protein
MAKQAKTGMKLAEALIQRNAQIKKIEQLRDRIAKSARVDKGEKPAERPEELLKQALAAIDEQHSLVVRINLSNNVVKLKDGRTIMEAISQREALIAKAKAVREAIAASHKKDAIYGESKVKQVAVLDIAKLEKQADDLSSRARELNVMIQEANWSSLLVLARQ